MRRQAALWLTLLAWLLGSALTSGPALASADEAPNSQLRVEPDPSAQAEVEARLGSGRYRFCTDEAYRLWQADKDRLCARSSDVAAGCASLPAACARPAWDEKIEDHDDSPSWLAKLAALLGAEGGALVSALFWLLLAAGAVYLLVRLVRVFRVSQAAEEKAPKSPVLAATEELDPEGQAAGALLERAAQYLEAGDARRALHFVYAALLAGLARAGKVRLHKALTTGDYRRALRRAEGDQSAGSLLWDLDLSRFRHAVDSDGARELLVRVRDLLTRLSPLLLFLTLGCGEMTRPEGPFEPTAPRGYALFEELAKRQATSFNKRLRRVTELPDGTSAVVLLAPHLRDLEWDTLRRYVEDGGHLIAAGRMEGLGPAFGLDTGDVACTGPIGVVGLKTIAPDTPTTSLHALEAQASDAILASCGQVDFARVHVYGDGQVTLVGDESIFDNTSLSLAHNASFVMALVASEPGHMEFIGPWTGAGAMHPLESITRSSVGPWLLHLLAALALLAWSRGRRFGTPQAPELSKRRSLVLHAHALAGHYRHQGDVGAALARYAAWAVSLLGRRSGSSTRDLRALSLALVEGRGKRQRESVTAAELHQILLRARSGAELGGDKAKLMRAYRVLRGMVDEVSGKN
jgi:hypothetical protein